MFQSAFFFVFPLLIQYLQKRSTGAGTGAAFYSLSLLSTSGSRFTDPAGPLASRRPFRLHLHWHAACPLLVLYKTLGGGSGTPVCPGMDGNTLSRQQRESARSAEACGFSNDKGNRVYFGV